MEADTDEMKIVETEIAEAMEEAEASIDSVAILSNEPTMVANTEDDFPNVLQNIQVTIHPDRTQIE